MAIRWEDIVYGPIRSRRLGSSLGVNLMPRNGKWCTFDCIYCECGWDKDGKGDTVLPSKEEVFNALENKLNQCLYEKIPVDTITFSGSGEPTLHPDFTEIIDFTISLRNKLFPSARISVLSNSTQLGREGIKEALARIDNPILKIDAGIDEAIKVIDKPQIQYSLEHTVNQLRWFKGDFILQTMFLRGTVGTMKVDCTLPELTKAWIDLVLDLHPREVMMYTLDRVPPVLTLEKVSVKEMEAIAQPLIDAGIKVQIKG